MDYIELNAPHIRHTDLLVSIYNFEQVFVCWVNDKLSMKIANDITDNWIILR